MNDKKSLSHSESVRRRRLEQLRRQQGQTTRESQLQVRKPRLKKKTTRSGYRELPPITARGVVNDFAIERRKKTGKRRFSAVLTLPRPKIRSVTLPGVQIRFGWRLFSFFLVLLFGTGLYLSWTLPYFRVSSAQVVGNQRISADEINSVLEINGRPIFMLTPNSVREQALRNYPELASVQVNMTLPNIVTVNVIERQPVILWQKTDGFTWVDETGTAFRPRGEAQGLIVVQALGEPPAINNPENADPLIPPQFITEETVATITALAPHVPAGTSILYDPVLGLSWADVRGWQAIFGSSKNDTEAKIRVYDALVSWLTQRGIQPVLINVAYPKAPFYRVEQAQVKEQ